MYKGTDFPEFPAKKKAATVAAHHTMQMQQVQQAQHARLDPPTARYEINMNPPPPPPPPLQDPVASHRDVHASRVPHSLMAQHVHVQSSWTQKDSEAEFLFRMQQHQLEQRGLDGGANVGGANVHHRLGNSARPLFSKVLYTVSYRV
jgi:hypothetical protein